MSETVTVELPDELSRRARKLAAAANRRLEDAVVDWIRQALSEWEVESGPDDELLRLCDATLEAAEQEELSNRLAEAREGNLIHDWVPGCAEFGTGTDWRIHSTRSRH